MRTRHPLLALTALWLSACPPVDTETDPDSDTSADTDSDTVSTDWGVATRPTNTTCAPWTGSAPTQLSASGCVDRADAGQPGEMLVPYGLHSPLWSDDADKDRYLSLPEGGTLTLGADGDFIFPTGSVLGKWFYLDGSLIEVRLLALGSTGWVGASWKWDEDTGDGVLVPAGETVTLTGGQEWTYPSTFQCNQCHTAAAAGALGPEVGQLNGDWTYPNGVTANQLDNLEHIGFITTVVPDVAVIPAPFGDADLQERARGYLHSNCSGCHRPGGGTPYTMDMRFEQPFATADLCGVAASNPLGLIDMQRVAPGDAAHSMIISRMGNTTLRMPPVGSNVVDTAGTALVTEWIESLTACP